MPKLKTHQGAKKRVKLTGKGKLLRRKAYSGHLLAKKSSSRKRSYSRTHKFSNGDKHKVKRSLGI